jgi:single-stranded-DNA-specific exonuclease
MEFRWKQKEEPSEEAVSNLEKSLQIPRNIAYILAQRGVSTYDEAENYFRPKLSELHDPFLMKDMDLAVKRIEAALLADEKMMVYGDYDVDGTTAVSVVYSFLTGYSNKVVYYIPDRYDEGYGVSKQGIDVAKEQGISLIIALDCGIRSVELVAYAKSLGIDFIICDHHLPGEKLPDAVAVLDPKRADCTYPFKELSGCGIGFKLVQAFNQINNREVDTLFKYLDLVVVSIASDIVEMNGENRILSYHGLKVLNESPRIGIQALLNTYKHKSDYSISDIVFGLGPKINAAGRIADAGAAVKLLIEEDFHEAVTFTKVLLERNTERQGLDSGITQEALDMLANDKSFEDTCATVIYGKEWHKGVIGIVASRLIENYYKPTIVLTENDGIMSGSARSVRGFDIHDAIEQCSELLLQYGGHMYAAGLSLKSENFEAFKKKFEGIVSNTIKEDLKVPEIEYDAVIDMDDVSPKMLRILRQMEPFGPGNMKPIFRSNQMQDTGFAKVLKDKHLKLSTKNSVQKIDAIGFGMAHVYDKVTQGKPFDACFTIEENEYKGQKNIQLNLKDIK